MNRTKYATTRRCAQCWGPVVATHDGDLICSKGCKPGGHVDAGWVEAQIAKSAIEYERVAQNYPELAPNRLRRMKFDEAVNQLF